MKVECVYKELVPLEKIIPNPRNPNTHSKEQIKLLAKIIDAQGWRAPITVSNRSGSTLIACEKLGRRCYGMEIDPMYCTVIINRWQNFTGKTAELQKPNTESYTESKKKLHENRLVKVKK